METNQKQPETSTSPTIPDQQPLKKSSSTTNTNINKEIIVCPKCLSIPLITISVKGTSIKLHIRCEQCKLNEKTSFSDYFEKIKDLLSKGNSCSQHPTKKSTRYCIECNQFLCQSCSQNHNESKENNHKLNIIPELGLFETCCLNHNNKKFKFFCNNCHKNLCEDCDLTSHKSSQHKLLNLNDICQTNFHLKIIEKYQEWKEYFGIEFENIKYKYINYYKSKLQQLENILNEYEKKNKDLMKYYGMVIKNYLITHPNYYQIQNLSIFDTLELVEYNENDSSFGKNIDEDTFRFVTYMETQPLLKLVNPIQKINLKSFIQFEDHTEPVLDIIALDNNKLATCSADRSIRFYDLKTFNLLNSINNAHDNIIYSLCQIQDKLVSTSSDLSIKIWDLESLRCVFNIQKAHNDEIKKLISLTKGRFASCSNDKTIKIWSSAEGYDNICVLKKHLGAIRSIIQLKDGRLVSCCHEDKAVVFWDLNSYMDVQTIPKVIPNNGNNNMIEIQHNRLIVGGSNNRIIIIDCDNYIIEKEITDSAVTNALCFSYINNKVIVCGCIDGNICFLNTAGNNYSFTLNKVDRLHFGSIIKIVNVEKIKTVFSCSLDGAVLLSRYDS